MNMHTCRWLLCLLWCCWTLSAAAAEPAGLPWYRQYQPIESQEAERFVTHGLAYARQWLGEPRVAVQQVYLRYSTPLDPHSQIRRNFQLCEPTDSAHGIFTIYLSRRPSEYAFDGQLAHEVAHLLNARLADAYVEGLNTVFAERLLRRDGRDWRGWAQYLEQDDPFYGATYAMMKNLWETVGDQAMRSFLSFAVDSDGGEKMHIDIDRWLASLSPEVAASARRVIAQHAPTVRTALQSSPTMTFLLPSRP